MHQAHHSHQKPTHQQTQPRHRHHRLLNTTIPHPTQPRLIQLLPIQQPQTNNQTLPKPANLHPRSNQRKHLQRNNNGPTSPTHQQYPYLSKPRHLQHHITLQSHNTTRQHHQRPHQHTQPQRPTTNTLQHQQPNQPQATNPSLRNLSQNQTTHNVDRGVPGVNPGARTRLQRVNVHARRSLTHFKIISTFIHLGHTNFEPSLGTLCTLRNTLDGHR